MSAPQNMWSRRRAAVQAEVEADEKADQDAVVAQERAVLEEKTDAEILAELDLKDPDEMGIGDDFSAFMKAAVPDRLRRRALRKLWLSNPVLANVDNLVDYGEDFTDAANIVGNLQTAYQVGKGMLKHVEEMARQAAEAEQAENAAPVADEVAEELQMTEPGENDIVEQGEPAVQDVQTATVPAEDETTDFVVKRKIRFEFAD